MLKRVLPELKEHIPYSVFAAAFALVGVGTLSAVCSLLDPGEFPRAAGDLFHVLHPVHMLLSSAASTAMFWRHERQPAKAVAVGLLGATVVCGVSDILLPFLGGELLGVHMHLHICLLEHPLMVLPFVLAGIATGLLAAASMPRATIFSHACHVLVSSMASVTYLIAYGLENWLGAIGGVLVVIVLAVLIPCCLSDIAFPLLAASGRKETHGPENRRGPSTRGTARHRNG